MIDPMRAVAMAAMMVAVGAAAQLPKPPDPLWEPIADTVYPQEFATIVATDSPLRAAAVFRGALYVGDAQGLWRLDGDTLVGVPGFPGAVTTLEVIGDALVLAGPAGAAVYDSASFVSLTSLPVTDLCEHLGGIAFLSGDTVYSVDGAAVRPVSAGGRPLLGVASHSGTLYVHDGRRVGLYDGERIVYDGVADWGVLQRGSAIRDMMAYGSRLIVATDEGLAVLRGMTWYPVTGEDGLCYEATTSLARGFDRDLWIGTERGAIRNVGDNYQYFSYTRWIPNDHVNAIACGQNAVYIATDGGLGIVRYEPYTLAKKAAYYERWLEEWGQKRLGFTHGLFLRDGEWLREVSDNDVGFSSHYLAAKCFEYAVTKNKAARAEAVDMMKTVKWSEEITPIEGFPARSIYAVGERTVKAEHGSGGLPAEWHPTEDGAWEWKGDTSSDETDAHVYETSLFLELVANDEERVWAAEHLDRVIGHIVDNGYVLRDYDGLPTRWARWDPGYLQTPYGYYARGLNGLEAFNYLTTAYHFTGDAKFATAKEEYKGFNYFYDILHQKITFPPLEFTHFDDRLAFYSYYSLLRYETDPALRSIWLRSLERSWEIKRIESLPWFNFIYGAVTGNDCETEPAVAHLREWPMDLHQYAYTNSHRDDLHPPKGYRMYSERPKPLSPRETAPNRWDGNFMELDGGSGAAIADPAGWLDAYWMGRYYGMIGAPETKDPALTTVEKRGLQLGAKPYAGPPRPKLKHER